MAVLGQLWHSFIDPRGKIFTYHDGKIQIYFPRASNPFPLRHFENTCNKTTRNEFNKTVNVLFGPENIHLKNGAYVT